MRILFILKQTGYVRHFTTVVQAFADRGHTVRLACQDAKRELPSSLQGHPNISIISCGSKRGDQWQNYVSLVRRAGDYLRYLTPPFANARKLRARAFEKLLHTLSNGERESQPGWSDLALGLSGAEQERLTRFFTLVQRAVPADQALQDWVRQEEPDLVLVTPLVDIGSGQADYVKACRSLGVPIAMVLFSWDNLSTKGLIHEMPDRIFLWNDLQVKEAVELHGVPPKLLTVTGAPRFDDFFALKPSTTREDYCSLLGFDPVEPIVIYLGSSKFVAEHEEPFIRRWIEAVHAEPELSRANLLIKPHPDVHRSWGQDGARIKWSTPGGEVACRLSHPFPDTRVAVARAPFSGAQFLYDCLHHSVAAVGLNTSAEIEAGIVGRPVLTIRVSDEFADGQGSTLHFHYLLKERGGFVEIASDLRQHCDQLKRAVQGKFDQEEIRRFITAFVRPEGLNHRASDSLVRAVERMMKRVLKRRQQLAVPAPGNGSVASPVFGRDAAPRGRDSAETESELVDLDYRPLLIRLKATSAPERQWRARSCRKEPWTVEWIERVVREGSVLYDIGANVGTFTLIAACRERGATVVAFEPGYASYAHLCDNIVLNRCQRNVIPIPLPLWSSTTMVGFKYRSLVPGQSRHAIRNTAYRDLAVTDRYEQPELAVRLDDLMRQYGLPPPTAIKLDVDGAELEVLKGACETLRVPTLETLLVEYAPQLKRDVTALLERAGFEEVATVDRTKADAPGYAEFFRRDR